MSEDGIVRIGLIGAGWIGGHHGRNIARSTHAELTAVADPDTGKAAALVARECPNADVYADYQEMLLRPDIDAVVVASPNAMHAEQAVAAAQAGKHIYLEKPMAIRLGDCREIVLAVREAGVKCAMGYHRRLNPLARYAKRLLEEGKLGDVVLAESDYIHYIPGDWDIWTWLGKDDVAGSPIHGGAGHNVDLLRYLCGEVASVACFKDIRMPRPVQVETEDIAIINLRFSSGALGRVVMFIGPVVPFTFNLRLYGTSGTVDNTRVWLKEMPCFDAPGGDCIRLPESWIPDNVQGGISETWKECIEAFIDDVRLGRRPLNDEVSGFNTAAVCFAAIDSAASGRAIAPVRL